MSVNRSDLIEQLALKANIPHQQAEEIIHLIFDNMADSMVRGRRIEIRGFGSFCVKEYGAYTGRNPRTGESIQVKPKRLPYFKVGKELRARVDQSTAELAVDDTDSVDDE